MARAQLSAEQATAALESMRQRGGALDTAVLEEVPLTEAELLRALGEVSGRRTLDLLEFELNREVSSVVPPQIAEQLGVVPLWEEPDAVHLACAYPPSEGSLQQISSLIKKRVEAWICLEVRIRDWLGALYGAPLSDRHASLLDRLNAARATPARKRPVASFSEATTLEQTLRQQLGDKLPAATSSPLNNAYQNGHVDSEWTLAEARAALQGAMNDRDEIIQVALRFTRQTFDFGAVFAVLRGAASLWAVRGDFPEPQRVSLSIPLDAASVFRTVCTTGRSYAGPMPPDPLTRGFLEQLGRSPRTIFLFPVEVSGRLVAIVYGDCAQRPMSRRGLSDFLLFCQDLPAAFQELILRRRPQAPTAHLQPASAGGSVAPESLSRLVWAVPDDGDEQTPVKARAKHASPAAARFRPDFAALLRTLTGPDPDQRAQVLEELARFPQAAADKLILHFPGPTAWSRLPVVELPHAEELGPIPGALAFLGEPAATALAPLLDSKDLDTRYFALLTAGSLASPELLDGIFRALLAPEAAISSAARAAASAFRGDPEFNRALEQLRQELSSPDPNRGLLAAQALDALATQPVSGSAPVAAESS